MVAVTFHGGPKDGETMDVEQLHEHVAVKYDPDYPGSRVYFYRLARSQNGTPIYVDEDLVARGTDMTW